MMTTTASDILYSFPRKIDLGLDRVKAALDGLGRPQDLLPPIIHVAGTNGKGSTVAFLRAIVEAAELKAHVYTSPHLVTIHERWRLAGQLISEPELLDLALEVEKLSEKVPVTVFEAETLIAFLAFAKHKADFTLLEVGLGGRLDATNVIDRPAMTIITPVDIDHSEMLGKTISLIAAEKAGILKPQVPCVVGRQQDEALASIEVRAREVAAKLFIFGRDWDCFAQNGRLVVQGEDRLLDLPLPNLVGAHQIENAGAAAMAMSLLGIAHDAIGIGITQAKWPARLQRLTSGVYGALAKAFEGEVWLDGGHNPHGARAACAFINERTRADPRPFGLVSGLLGTKDKSGFFAAFKPAAPFVVCVPVASSDAGLPPDILASEATKNGLTATIAANPVEGVTAAFERLGRGARILICGSLYLAGEVLTLEDVA